VICGGKAHLEPPLTLRSFGTPPGLSTTTRHKGPDCPYTIDDATMPFGFIRYLTNVFALGIVVSEQLVRAPWSEQTAVPASRTTMQPCGADYPASLYHLAPDVSPSASSWGFLATCEKWHLL
jgi:hypothetical protein